MTKLNYPWTDADDLAQADTEATLRPAYMIGIGTSSVGLEALARVVRACGLNS